MRATATCSAIGELRYSVEIHIGHSSVLVQRMYIRFLNGDAKRQGWTTYSILPSTKGINIIQVLDAVYLSSHPDLITRKAIRVNFEMSLYALLCFLWVIPAANEECFRLAHDIKQAMKTWKAEAGRYSCVVSSLHRCWGSSWVGLGHTYKTTVQDILLFICDRRFSTVIRSKLFHCAAKGVRFSYERKFDFIRRHDRYAMLSLLLVWKLGILPRFPVYSSRVVSALAFVDFSLGKIGYAVCVQRSNGRIDARSSQWHVFED